jgi:phosphomethylpyrimidine synthase
LYYAKQGIITQKWNTSPLEKNQRIEQLNDQSAAMQCQHQGHSWGANT